VEQEVGGSSPPNCTSFTGISRTLLNFRLFFSRTILAVTRDFWP
jgi:hypothetical protein